MKKLILLMILCSLFNIIMGQNLLDYAETRIRQNNNPEQDYIEGDKWLFFIQVPNKPVTIFFDMSDYMGITEEGQHDIVTCWIYLSISVSLPVGFGSIKIPYQTPYPIINNSEADMLDGIIVSVGAEFAGVSLINWNVSNSGQFNTTSIEFLEWSETDLSLGFGTNFNLINFELSRELVDDLFKQMLTPGISTTNCANIFSNLFINEDGIIPILNHKLRRATISDKWEEIEMKVRYENLVVNRWGSLFVDVTPIYTDYYRVNIYDDLWNTGLFNFLPPEWYWDNTFMGIPRSITKSINDGETYTFEFRVMPTDAEGDFNCWLYKGDGLITPPIRWATAGPIYALPEGADIIPPFVQDIIYTGDINTNITINFSESISEYTINDQTITVTGTESGSVDYDILYSDENEVLILNPHSDFKPGEIVDIVIYEFIQDYSGNRLLSRKKESFIISESTESEVTIVEISSNSYNLETNEKVTISVLVKDQFGETFEDQPINFSSNNSGTFNSENPIYTNSIGIATTEYTPHAEGDHKIISIAENGKTDYLTLKVGGSVYPPVITLNYPNNEVCHDECFIGWTAEDPDNNAEIYFFYDDNNSGENGICINPNQPLFEDAVNGYIWNTLEIQEGIYWIYAIIEDGTNQDIDYSPGYIEIKHPELNVDFEYNAKSAYEDTGDGDEIIESGESFELDVRISNESSEETYYLVNGILISNNPNVTITDNDSYYGSFNVGEAKWGEDDYDIQVVEGYVGPVDFDLKLQFNDASGYAYYQILDIPDIYISENVSPGFEVIDILVIDDGSKCNNDGILNSGENSIDYKLKIRNNGTGEAIDVYCEVQALPEDYETDIVSADYPDISSGEAEWTDPDDHFYLREIPNDFSGILNAQVNVFWADEQFNELIPFDFNIQTAPRLYYNPEITDFGMKSLGDTAIIPITIKNYGSSDLIITQIEDLSLNTNNWTTEVEFPLTIIPGNNTIAYIKIKRDVAGNVNETFRIHSNNHVENIQDIIISGTFYDPIPQGYKTLWASDTLGAENVLDESNDNSDWIYPADLDNDGLIDLALNSHNELEIWEQKKPGSYEFEHKFTYTIPGTDAYIMALDIGNCDGDDKLDIVIREQDQGVDPMVARMRIFESNGNDSYVSVWTTVVSAGYNSSLDVGNSDNDINDEIQILSYVDNTLKLKVYNSNGDNSYSNTWTSTDIKNYDNTLANYSTTGDFDNNGKNEIILAGEDNYLFIWEYNSTYTLKHTPIVDDMGNNQWGDDVYPKLGDIDCDGSNEIILTGDGDDGYQFVVFDPINWSIEFHNNTGLYGDLLSPAIYDLNGNSIPEVFLSEDDFPWRLIVYEYDNGSYFETFKSESLEDDIYNIEPIDLDGDGNYELILTAEDLFMVWGYEEIPIIPDLTILENNLNFSNYNPTDDEIIEITALIQNLGTGDCEDIPVEFYISDPEQGNRIDSITISELKKGNDTLIKVNWSSFQTGSFDIYSIIDRNNKIAESDSLNNYHYKSLTIVDNDTISPTILNHSHNEFDGDSDNLIEDNEYIQISWRVEDESGISQVYVLFNDIQTLNALNTETGSYNSFIAEQEPGLYPYEIIVSDNDNTSLTTTLLDTLEVIKHSPEVIYIYPMDGESSADVKDSILVQFDISLNSYSVNNNTFLVVDKEKNITVNPIYIKCYFNENKVIFKPEKLNYETIYNVKLISGENGIKDINDNSFDHDKVFSFQTNKEPLSADFVSSINKASPGEIINFMDISLGDPIDWYWEFGDGETSTLQNPSYSYDDPGIYSVKLSINNQSSSDEIIKEKYMNISCNINVELGEDINRCEGDTVILDAGTGFDSYHWSTGETEQKISVNETGTFDVEVFSENGCSNSDTINVIFNPSYEISIDTSICEGENLFAEDTNQTESGTYYDNYSTQLGCDSTIITNLTVNPTYELTINTSICDGESLFVADAEQTVGGTYYDYLNSITSCDSTIITNLTVNNLPEVFLGNDTTINDAITLDAGSGFKTYTWSTGDDEQTIVVNESFGYDEHEISVIVMDYSNCSNSDTILITIEQSTFISDGIKDTQIRLYPNPTKSKIYVEFDDVLTDNLLLEIIDVNGQKIISREIKQNHNKQKLEFDLSTYSQGIYFIKIYLNSEITTKKVILQ